MFILFYVCYFVVVEEVEIIFGLGLIVVSGEIGVGKLLLVDVLMLLVGLCVDSGMVCVGSDCVELVVEFDLGDLFEVCAWLQCEELDDEGVCQLWWVICIEGSLCVWINGCLVNVSQFGELVILLVEIYGQYEYQVLFLCVYQMMLLDVYVGYEDILVQVCELVSQWCELGVCICVLSGGDDCDCCLELLCYEVGELDKWVLLVVELVELEILYKCLVNVGRLVEGVFGVVELIDGDSEFVLCWVFSCVYVELIWLVVLDEWFNLLLELVDNVGIQFGEVLDDLVCYVQDVDLDLECFVQVDVYFICLYEFGWCY